MESKMTGKRIWITGGGSGIGAALALQLSAMGNTVVISGRNVERLDKTVATSAGNIKALTCDVSDETQISSTRNTLKEMLGLLDVVVVCAGHCEYVEDADLDVGLFRRVFEVNVFGAVNTVQTALPLLDTSNSVNGNRPQVVTIGSLSQVLGLPRAEAYGASKAALDYFSRSLKVDLASKGIDVSIIHPGFVATPMTDKNDFAMPFLMTVEQAANRIVNAIEKRRSNYSFPKRLLWPLWLGSKFPFLWYRYIAPRLSR